MVGKNIMQATYWAIDPVVRGLVAPGATPNSVTCAALVFGVATGSALTFGQFTLACLLASISTIGDILDGQVARVTRFGSTSGGLNDDNYLCRGSCRMTLGALNAGESEASADGLADLEHRYIDQHRSRYGQSRHISEACATWNTDPAGGLLAWR